jgi:hypothetical protein
VIDLLTVNDLAAETQGAPGDELPFGIVVLFVSRRSLPPAKSKEINEKVLPGSVWVW